MPINVDHFATLASKYEAFLLDLWGVVHDGTSLYPGARECLQQLHRLQKKVVMISNAPRRASKAQVVLDKLGLARDLYVGVITSGEVAYQSLKTGMNGRFRGNETYFFIGPERDADVLNGLNFRPASVRGANFLLNVGFGGERDTVADFKEVLKQAMALEIPMLCLNPDLEVVKLTGERFECAGVIAQQYEKMGGVVHYFGKPYNSIYEYAHGMLGELHPSKILAIGDGLQTDIQGANQFGVDSMLITGGILKGAAPLELQRNITPNYIAPSWVW